MLLRETRITADIGDQEGVDPDRGVGVHLPQPASLKPFSRAPGVRTNLRKDAEARLSLWELEELGVDAAEPVGPVLVARLDLAAAHREWVAPGFHGAEAGTFRLGRLEQVEVDVNREHALHAADVRVAELLVRVEERTRSAPRRHPGRRPCRSGPRTGGTRSRLVDEAQLSCRLRLRFHIGILLPRLPLAQDLTWSVRCARRVVVDRRAAQPTGALE